MPTPCSGDHNIPSTPRPTNAAASQLTLRSSSFHVSSPTSTSCFSSALTSSLRARRREGEEVISRRDSSVSRLSDRVERLDDPMKVKKGWEGDLTGESQMPKAYERKNHSRQLDSAAPGYQLTFSMICPSFPLPLSQPDTCSVYRLPASPSIRCILPKPALEESVAFWY